MPTRPSLRRTRTSVLLSTLTLALGAFGVASAPAQARVSAAECGPAIAAHATNAADAPANTLGGIRATPAGVGWVEMDVQWTSSSFPILMHNQTIDGTTNGPAVAANTLGLSQVTSYLAQDYAPWNTDPRFADEHVPYAGDFLKEVALKGLRPILDITGVATEAGMAKLALYLDRFGLRDKALIMSSYTKVTAMKGWQPDFAYGVDEYPQASGMIRSADSIRALGLSWYIGPEDQVDADKVAYWHSAGVKVGSWTSDNATHDTAAKRQAKLDANVDMVITNYPAQALAECQGVSYVGRVRSK